MIATNEIKIHLFIVSIRWHSLAFIYSMMSYLLLMQNMTVSPTGNTRVAWCAIVLNTTTVILIIVRLVKIKYSTVD